jgi:multidrug efflux pump subunit AcrA (membrane-fusion protein)
MPQQDILINDARPLNGHRVSSSFIESRSEEVQEIISKMPHWVIRRGSMMLLIVTILLISGAWFIHYPDVIVTQVAITSTNPPLKIVALSSGKIRQIFVRNNEMVSGGDNLCLLDNPAVFNDVVKFKSLLVNLDTTTDLAGTLRRTALNRQVQLGELQPGYAELCQSISQYRFFKEKNFIAQKVGQLQSQLNYQAQLQQELERKDRLLQQQLKLEMKKNLADSSLVAEKVIAPLEFDNSRKELITRQINADATRSGILQNKLQQSEYVKNITDLEQQKLQQENDLKQKISENVKRLLGQLDQWEQKYLIKSPVEGRTAFFRFWKENQYVNSGESVMMIVPPVREFIARSSLPVEGAGKVRPGQKVLIKLTSYPFEEFGMITGNVVSVSPVTFDTAYSMEISLSNGLTTTLQRQIPQQPQLTGIAEVLTSDRNILQRLFEKIWIRLR